MEPVDPQTTDAADQTGALQPAAAPSPLAVSAGHLTLSKAVNIAGIRPVSPSNFQVKGFFDDAGHRPVGADSFQIVHTIRDSGVRPVGASLVKIDSSTEFLGRPVGADSFQIVHTIRDSGVRPVGASLVKIDGSTQFIGNRPVASNELDDSAVLMGYLD